MEICEDLTKLEAYGIPYKLYCERIAEVLKDAARPGAPAVFTAEQVVQIIAVACEVLDGSDAPLSHWTQKEIAAEAVRRGIVKNVSRASVQRFLAQAAIKPHLNRYWLSPRPEDAQQFSKEVKAICDLYSQAQALHRQGVRIFSVDEKTGIQALERMNPTLPALPAGRQRVERREHSYDRHGTLCLIANFEVATGRVVAPTIGATRTEEDFLKHIEQTVATAPEANWVFISDNLNTHQSESLVRFVAARCGIDKELGVKGKKGILARMETRKNFLSDPRHRIFFVFTPKHTSWLNQVEIWFSILSRRLLNRGSFKSVEQLEERILKFIEFFNETMAKPFKWTCKGQPLTV
jgi:transposase